MGEVISKNAATSWTATDVAPVRLVFDCENAHPIFKEILELLDFGEAMNQLILVSENANAVSLSLFPKSNNLLELKVDCRSQQKFPVLRKRLDFLSFELRGALNKILLPMRENKKAAAIAIDGVSVTGDNESAMISVAKPARFDRMLKQALQGARQYSEPEAVDKGSDNRESVKIVRKK